MRIDRVGQKPTPLSYSFPFISFFFSSVPSNGLRPGQGCHKPFAWVAIVLFPPFVRLAILDCSV
jgi:hypothetical protein